MSNEQPRLAQHSRQNDLQELIDADLDEDEEPPRGTKNLMSRDFALAKFSQGEVDAMRFLFKNQHELAESERPPAGSMIQGPIRAALSGDPTDRATALDPAERASEYSERLQGEARVSRSKDGYQQDKLVEQRNVQVLDEQQGQQSNEQDPDAGVFGIFG